ncbi:MAG: redoxin family protein, partial [Candidatus Sericytochromatia bacterium]|nr:redoxin family protein [Candidatus Tanganyikabacteria bacterium]
MKISRTMVRLVAVVTAIAIAIVVVQRLVPSRAPGGPATAPDRRATGAEGVLLPEVQGIAAWINSQPLTVAALRGKVVLVDFWTYSCVNCLRTLPYLKEWHAKYASRGLVILGVHTPEFHFEKDAANVRAAVAKHGVTWPVALDNDYATWEAYGNRYWPHKYLGDSRGVRRYDHIGEGAYSETERWIRQLLTEAGGDVSDIPTGARDVEEADGGPITRELYAGSAWVFGFYIGNPAPDRQGSIGAYTDSGERRNGKLYLQGRWEQSEEYVRLDGTRPDAAAYVAIGYRASGVNVVARAEAPSPLLV